MGKIPNRALTDIDLLKHCKTIPYFGGVFMRNALPLKIWRNECGIGNLDDKCG